MQIAVTLMNSSMENWYKYECGRSLGESEFHFIFMERCCHHGKHHHHFDVDQVHLPAMVLGSTHAVLKYFSLIILQYENGKNGKA